MIVLYYIFLSIVPSLLLFFVGGLLYSIGFRRSGHLMQAVSLAPVPCSKVSKFLLRRCPDRKCQDCKIWNCENYKK